MPSDVVRAAMTAKGMVKRRVKPSGLGVWSDWERLPESFQEHMHKCSFGNVEHYLIVTDGDPDVDPWATVVLVDDECLATAVFE